MIKKKYDIELDQYCIIAYGRFGGKDDFATAGASTDFSLTDIKNKIKELITSEMEKL